ncbi:hypothetical protein [Streptomyces sp. A1547]|uniref:hypothetical protein n=1 Tax=Streptomyces sp. A1547 TaxID=2563105 RepID=UPI00061FDCA1|nr:hypothetical protein [Streptomyces sp. A1547]KJY26964.1 hypothetical protein VR46_39590 [Streptomyces sp. NRRL S-444]THA31886.1 hypothetical protein E6W17_34805 [Streptomyces sp. A1547]
MSVTAAAAQIGITTAVIYQRRKRDRAFAAAMDAAHHAHPRTPAPGTRHVGRPFCPREDPPGPVSVMGDFNDWQPRVHTLQPRKDGKRAVTVAP